MNCGEDSDCDSAYQVPTQNGSTDREIWAAHSAHRGKPKDAW